MERGVHRGRRPGIDVWNRRVSGRSYLDILKGGRRRRTVCRGRNDTTDNVGTLYTNMKEII